MKTLQLSESQDRFSSVLWDIRAGNDVAVTYGERRETVAVIIPYEKWKKSQGRMSVAFADDFSMTDEELVGV